MFDLGCPPQFSGIATDFLFVLYVVKYKYEIPLSSAFNFGLDFVQNDLNNFLCRFENVPFNYNYFCGCLPPVHDE